MDVSLVLTHRCNLACSYCFAGEHHGEAMAPAIIERATALLYADEPEVAQLSFFGGEPFLALPAMRHAIEVARRQADAARRPLLLQVTSNGTLIGPAEAAFVADAEIDITLSIDGVREAHERQRPRAGGRSSFDAATRGMHALLAAGAAPAALLVITPETVGDLEASVAWLWSEGIDVVRANLDLRATWSADDREDLRAALLGVGAELIRARQGGRDVVFKPFAESLGGRRIVPRPRVVVGTTGHLYPCAPMVGEDRDSGPEAGRRLGHLDDPTAEIVRRVFAEGVHCSTQGNCACAATLETGKPDALGPNGAFWKALITDVGAVVAAELAQPHAPAPASVGAAAGVVALAAPEPDRRPRRRALLGGAIMGAGALGFVTASLPHLLRVVHQKRACSADAALAASVGGCGGGGESFDDAAAAGVSDGSGLRAQSVLDRVALQQMLAQKTAQPIPIPKAGPPRHHKPRHDFETMSEGVMMEPDIN